MALPVSVSILKCLDGFPSSPDSVSRLSEPSAGVMATLSSPTGATNIGLPRTPKSRVVKPLDEAAMEEGYDPEGLQAP